jgi:hypothetical protein
MNCRINIDGISHQYDIGGVFNWGRDEILFNHYQDAINRTKWLQEGFNVLNVLEDTDHLNLVKSIQTFLFNNFEIDFRNCALSEYHKHVTSEQHLKIIEATRELQYKNLDLNMDFLCQKISNELKRKVHTKNLLLGRDLVILRISRPNSLDINPPHRDGYLDIWKKTINLWIPLEGCTQKSSLPIMPGSHLINESEILRTEAKGATINSLSYHVPAIIDTKKGMNFIRPNPLPGQALIFTPFLIHGSSINEQKDVTRMSLEIRLVVDFDS